MMHAGELSKKTLLVGQTWMSSTNCQIDWVTNSVAMVIPKCPIGHCSHCEPYILTLSSTIASNPLPQIKHTTNSSEITHAQVTTNKRQQHNHPLTHHKRQTQWMWVSKKKPILPSPASHTQCQKKSRSGCQKHRPQIFSRHPLP